MLLNIIAWVRLTRQQVLSVPPGKQVDSTLFTGANGRVQTTIMMGKISLYSINSIDGFICSESGDFGWLDGFWNNEPYIRELNRYIEDIDLLVLNNNMFSMWYSHDVEWPFTSKRSIVISDVEMCLSLTKNVEVMCRAGKWIEKLRELKNEGNNILVLGDHVLVADIFAAGLMDELVVNTVPVVLGRGISLFKDIAKDYRWDLEDCRKLENSCVQARYQLYK